MRTSRMRRQNRRRDSSRPGTGSDSETIRATGIGEHIWERPLWDRHPDLLYSLSYVLDHAFWHVDSPRPVGASDVRGRGTRELDADLVEGCSSHLNLILVMPMLTWAFSQSKKRDASSNRAGD